jgi:hypothetical protein
MGIPSLRDLDPTVPRRNQRATSASTSVPNSDGVPPAGAAELDLLLTQQFSSDAAYVNNLTNASGSNGQDNDERVAFFGHT